MKLNLTVRGPSKELLQQKAKLVEEMRRLDKECEEAERSGLVKLIWSTNPWRLRK